jgi:DNA-binding NtrC family response regulator
MGQRQRDILCIDDDLGTLQLRQILLETFGYRVAVESNPLAGMRLFRKRNFDAVVLDYKMPEMDGGQLAMEMKRLHPEVPVVIMSGLPCLPAGAPRQCIDAFLSKSVPSTALISTLERVLKPAPAREGVAARWLRGAASVGSALGVTMKRVRKALFKGRAQTSKIARVPGQPARMH